MNLYILDWKGTLDRMSNPHGFIRALQSLGHKVILWSGTSTRYLPPKVAQSVDYHSLKETLGELRTLCDEQWPEIKEVFVSDDEIRSVKDQVEDIVTSPKSTRPWTFINPHDLNAHLTKLAT